MDAYYYSFTPTGVQVVDELLSAVASAGKYAHHTSDWTDECDTNNGHYQPSNVGPSCVAWIQNAANRAADAVRELEARAEAGGTEAKSVAWECRVDGDLWHIENDEACAMSFLENGDGSATRTITPLYRTLVHASAPSAETRQTVAWWIGPHDGLLAGATVNKSLADARIEHGATVRPLVFGDVATSAETRVTVTDEMVERAESAYDAWVSQKDSFAEHTLCNPEAMRFALEAALTGGESDGR
jgi:hypothetical protein